VAVAGISGGGRQRIGSGRHSVAVAGSQWISSGRHSVAVAVAVGVAVDQSWQAFSGSGRSSGGGRQWIGSCRHQWQWR
jgi:hypothetical protein